ncbi:MAG: AAA family ATPase, partial [Polyangiaceae bacterium]|nr:AAA family ATPase [Polyangiaceae bacterium]
VRRVLTSFVRVLATAEHPLVLFIDDLQWADSDSLEALRVICEAACTHLLVVVGYRENEVDPGHPLVAFLDSLRRADFEPLTLRLGPLDRAHVRELVEETVAPTGGAVSALAGLVHEKTHGNPFFVRQLLHSLYDDGLLRFDPRESSWTFELEAIGRVGITDNVIELMTRRLALLPADAQGLLELAACLGAEFELHTLAVVEGRAHADIAASLSSAREQGLVVRVGDSGSEARYRFLHDRVRQAAHERMPESRRAEHHLRIGRFLLAEGGDEVDAVNHLNLGSARVEDRAERVRLAELNLVAGRRAKSSNAFDAASHYLDAGLDLLPEEAFESCYSLALALHVEAAEAAFGRGDADRVARHSEVVLANARTILERVPIHTLEIRAGIARGGYAGAVDLALEVLRELGVALPRHPGALDFGRALVSTHAAIGRRAPAALVDLPDLREEKVAAAMTILQSAASCAYFAEPKLVPLIACTMVRLSLEHGNCGRSAYGYALYGLALAGPLHRIEEGYAFGELALAVLERYPARELVTVRLVVGAFISHYKEPLAKVSLDMLDAWRRSLDVGDIETAVYCTGAAL